MGESIYLSDLGEDDHCAVVADSRDAGEQHRVLVMFAEFLDVLCGHNHLEARRTDTYNGTTIYTVLADYQDYPNGGNGWLRIMEVYPATHEIKVKTYSPYLNQYQTDPDSEFSLSYDTGEHQSPFTLTNLTKRPIEVELNTLLLQ